MGQAEPNMKDSARSEFVTVPGRIGGLPVGLRNQAALKGKVPVPAVVEEQDNSDVQANDNLDFKSLTSGAELPDGTIYVGEADGAHWATTPKMLPRAAQHYNLIKNKDTKIIEDLTHSVMVEQGAKDYGHKDWELPSRPVGKLLYEKRNAGKLKGSFDPSEYKGQHKNVIWLSEVHADDSDYAWDQWFDDGVQDDDHRSTELSVRPVRRLPAPKP